MGASDDPAGWGEGRGRRWETRDLRTSPSSFSAISRAAMNSVTSNRQRSDTRPTLATRSSGKSRRQTPKPPAECSDPPSASAAYTVGLQLRRTSEKEQKKESGRPVELFGSGRPDGPRGLEPLLREAVHGAEEREEASPREPGPCEVPDQLLHLPRGQLPHGQAVEDRQPQSPKALRLDGDAPPPPVEAKPREALLLHGVGRGTI